MKNKYLVTTPDGEEVKRESTHEYTHVVFFKFSNMDCWGVNFCASDKLAKSKASYYHNCPGVVRDGLKVETVIEEIHDWWKPCETCWRFHCVGHEVDTLKQCFECDEVYENEKTCPC